MTAGYDADLFAVERLRRSVGPLRPLRTATPRRRFEDTGFEVRDMTHFTTLLSLLVGAHER